MSKTIRLNEKEAQALEMITLLINKKLIYRNQPTLKDTEVFHDIFRVVVEENEIDINERNEIVLRKVPHLND